MFSTVYLADRRYGLPEFVKTAEAVDPVKQRIELAGLPDTAFADPLRRRFPIHTKVACYLSNVEFWDGALFADPEEAPVGVGRRLLDAARQWGIEDDVRNVTVKVASDYSKYTGELPDSTYALVFDWEGQKQRFFPMLDAETTKQAAADFFLNRTKFPWPLRKQAATRLLEKAASLGLNATELDGCEYLQQALGKQSSTSGWVSDAFSLRRDFCYSGPHRSVGDQLEKLAANIRNMPDDKVNDSFLDKSATLLDKIDRETGLHRHYGRGGLPLPEETIWRTLTKTASGSIKTARLQSGDRLTAEMVKSAGRDAFNVLPEYLDAVTTDGEFDVDKAMDVIPSMPRDDARMYVEAVMAKSAQVMAPVKTPAGTTSGPAIKTTSPVMKGSGLKMTSPLQGAPVNTP